MCYFEQSEEWGEIFRCAQDDNKEKDGKKEMLKQVQHDRIKRLKHAN